MLTVEISIDFARSTGVRSTGARGARAFALEIAFQAEAGITVLFGPSGAGKSSTLAAIAGLITPRRGIIKLNNRLLFEGAQKINVPMQQRNIGMVFQQLALFEHMSVLDNVCYGLIALPRAARRARAAAMLARFEIAELAAQRPGELSGGERQRVALARTLVTEPRALLLDEPLAALDAGTKRIIIEDLRKIAASAAIPILLVTHDRGEALALGEKMLVFEQGRIVDEGAPLKVLGAPRRLTVANLAGLENIFPGKISAVDAARGTMTVQVAEIAFEMPFYGHAVGDRITIGISANDILLALEKPVAISVRNIIAGEIAALESEDINLYVKVDCGVMVRVLITRHAADELKLAVGSKVWLAVKAHSCYLLEAD
jgi:molybdate transport system ATP-binding protein